MDQLFALKTTLPEDQKRSGAVHRENAVAYYPFAWFDPLAAYSALVFLCLMPVLMTSQKYPTVIIEKCPSLREPKRDPLSDS
jgi:hypothetical protein